MRLRHVKDIENKILDYQHIIILNPENYLGKWKELFSNNNPIYLEIGTGKGKFIKTCAKQNPMINFIGCELNSSVIYKAAKSIEDIPNLRLINYDAIKLSSVFSEGEINKIYLNFSDPWPKARHEKRRLTSEVFFSVYENILIKNGEIEFKTDNRKLFEYTIMKINELKHDMAELSFDLHNLENYQNEEKNIVTTEYEDKFINMGKVIYYVKVRLK